MNAHRNIKLTVEVRRCIDTSAVDCGFGVIDAGRKRLWGGEWVQMCENT